MNIKQYCLLLDIISIKICLIIYVHNKDQNFIFDKMFENQTKTFPKLTLLELNSAQMSDEEN